MSEQQALLYEQVGKVVKLTINRPEKRNAMNHAVMQGLHDAFDRIAEDDSVSVVVIGGAGEKAFTAGFDLKEAAGNNITDVMERREDTRGENALWLKMWNLHKPILTMIHGYTIGGGITIAMLSDMVFAASEGLKLGNPEVSLGYISSFPLSPYKLHFNKARELCLLGDFCDAQDLKEAGLVNRIFPYEKLEEETMKIAQRIAKTPLFSLSMMKQEMNKVYEQMGFFNTVDYAAEMFNLCRQHMNMATTFSQDINEKGLRHTIETKYDYVSQEH